MMEGSATAPAQAARRVSAAARTKPAAPSAIVPVAVALLAVAVAAVSLLPSLAQVVWELPHLFLLGLVISYGFFARKNADTAATGGGGGGARGWSARYHPDEPLVVVADHASDGEEEDGASERPLCLPVRRLKMAAQESDTGDYSDDGIGEEMDSTASTSTTRFWAGARAAPSPPAVLDSGSSRDQYNAATPSTMFSDDGEVTDWDDDADQSDEITASPEGSSLQGDFPVCVNHGNESNNGDGESVDDELFELATKAGPEGEDEVDRKADAFIAKFREQIRLQRLEPTMTT